MLKLVFKANNFFSIYENFYKILSKKQRKTLKIWNANILVRNIEIFMKKKNKGSINMVVNDTKIF